MGFGVAARSFTYSRFSGRFGTPLVGAAAALIVGIAGQAGAVGSRFVPLMTVGVGALLLLALGRWLARSGILTAPLLRAEGVNLEAKPPGVDPSLWICAHLDSKSQPIPTLARSAGIMIAGFGFLMTLVVALLAAAGAQLHPFFWQFAAAMTLIGAVPVVLSVVGASSPGALDNASGVATVMEAARLLGSRAGVGVLLTDAEELGLAGARAWAKTRNHRTVLNCDGVDDDGEIEVMYTGPRPAELLDAVVRASASTSVRHNAGRLLPGVLTDSVAFADAGMRSVTFSRGTFRSLARVHTKRDDLKHLKGAGIAGTAALIVATVRELGDKH